MTDKQIIIDGIDVSGCVQFIQDEKDYCDLGGTCKGWTNCYYKNWKRKEQECKELREERDSWHYQWEKRYEIGECLSDKIDQLKAEVKSKTEYIQEQRDIINQYSKEIEMYKKCQGKRASKREEELKAENEQLKNFHINLVGVKECEIKELAELKAENKHLNDLLNQALKELEQSREAIEKVREYSKCGWDMFMERNSYEDYEAMAEWMKNQFYFILQICDEVNE